MCVCVRERERERKRERERECFAFAHLGTEFRILGDFFSERDLILSHELFTWGGDTMGQVGSGAQVVGRSQLVGRSYRRLNFKKSEFLPFLGIFWTFLVYCFSSQRVIEQNSLL